MLAARYHRSSATVVIVALSLCALALTAFSDTITLRNGNTITCVVIKEMKDLVKVRMPHRGKVVTTFLNRGTIESIRKGTETENRTVFQQGGVHNPGRSFDPVYYSGSAPGPKTARGPGGIRPGTRRPGQQAGKTTKKRGVDERKKRSEDRAKERSDRSKASGSKSPGTASSPGTAPSSPFAPVSEGTSGTASTTTSSGGGSGFSFGGH